MPNTNPNLKEVFPAIVNVYVYDRDVKLSTDDVILEDAIRKDIKDTKVVELAMKAGLTS